MKRILFAMVALLVMSTTVMAQNRQRGERGQRGQMDRTEMVKRQTDRTVQDLGLSEEQAAALLKLNTEYSGKMGFGRGMNRGMGRGNWNEDGDRPSREEMEKVRKEMEETRAAYEASFKEILTEEQYTKYQELQKERGDRMRQGGMRQGGMNREGMRGERGNRNRNRE